MPRTKKHVKEAARQGYPKKGDIPKMPNVDLLANDIASLKTMANDPLVRERRDAILGLHVGKACDNLRGKVYTQLVDMATAEGALGKAIKTHRPDIMTVRADDLYTDKDPHKAHNLTLDNAYAQQIGALALKLGPLKKVPRMWEKAVHYAVCTDADDESDTARVEKVCDILRATIVCPEDLFTRDLTHPDKHNRNVGSLIIDAINEAFGDQVVQVKNRFIELRKPNLLEYAPERFLADLAKVQDADPPGLDDDDHNEHLYADRTLANLVANQVRYQISGRDTFYRDIQLLVKLRSARATRATRR